jgi:phosphatidylserine/phosphatidylglycerophosphate/cardiolipin synthase-like enzyme
MTRQPRHVSPLPDETDPPPRAGTHAVQVLRTYPAKRPPFPFAPTGERSVARSYLKAISRARRLVVIEDQYLWSEDAAEALVAAMRTHRDLHVVVIVPRFPDRDGTVSGAAAEYGRARVLDRLSTVGGSRVAAYDLENVDGGPIYVHAKACIIDDVWLEIGSDNLNRRSWTHDSEISCALIDEELDEREPADPAGLGDGARRLARATRLALWTEHLGRQPGEDEDLVDPEAAFRALASGAAALDDWAQNGRRGPRPPGHLRPHRLTPVPPWLKPFAAVMYHLVLDPDGRPRSDRAPGRY